MLTGDKSSGDGLGLILGLAEGDKEALGL